MANRALTRCCEFERGLCVGDHCMIEGLIKAVILRLDAAPPHSGWNFGRVENRRQVDALCLPVRFSQHGIELIHATDHFVHGSEAEFRHVLPHLFGDKEEEVNDVLGRAGEARAERRVLRGDAHRAGVEVALAHHNAADGDQRRSGEAELLGAQQGGNHHVASGLQLAVGLHSDAAAQIVEQQDLLGFGEAEFPRQARMLDGAERRGAGAAGVAGDEDHVGVSLRYAGCDRATPASATSLTAMRAFGLSIF